MNTDKLHYAILNELQKDARMSNAEIGRNVGLSAPAVAERIKRMQEEGIIKKFTTIIDAMKLNYQHKVVIAIRLPHSNIQSFIDEIEKIEGITNVVHVTGKYCFLINMLVKSTHELDLKISQFSKFGTTTTFSVLSTPIESKSIYLDGDIFQ
ncbi:Lrp/AsnC family transcriptional regulator [Elizabethkingia anophelis]|uniref:HTH asnC-type domain-containing protein n=1 Tax=Elizabethkingia anophelis TaxID=1117645 RepID=A0AAU8UVP3_9FLAO|nr:Lrp/AsnC family transcriptional regulator [Elizabethkingia anophelis]AQX01467.1 hypothetical protein BBD32_08335 [Elizabethkingia anophelis]OPB62028.1 hypothetical protein BAY11_16985 [Elizabethkingia anophelis]